MEAATSAAPAYGAALLYNAPVAYDDFFQQHAGDLPYNAPILYNAPIRYDGELAAPEEAQGGGRTLEQAHAARRRFAALQQAQEAQQAGAGGLAASEASDTEASAAAFAAPEQLAPDVLIHPAYIERPALPVLPAPKAMRATVPASVPALAPVAVPGALQQIVLPAYAPTASAPQGMSDADLTALILILCEAV